MYLAPTLVMVAVAATGSLGATALVSIVVPVSYAVMNGVFDFGVRWAVKGRTVKGSLMIWVDDGEEEQWQRYTGDVDKLATLHKNGRHVTHVERTVRFEEANPYSLGLNLTLGAFAVDFAAILADELAPIYLLSAFASHIAILLFVVLCIFLNQTAGPYEVHFIRRTAGTAIILGIIAVVIAFLIIFWSET